MNMASAAKRSNRGKKERKIPNDGALAAPSAKFRLCQIGVAIGPLPFISSLFSFVDIAAACV